MVIFCSASQLNTVHEQSTGVNVIYLSEKRPISTGLSSIWDPLSRNDLRETNTDLYNQMPTAVRSTPLR